MELAGIVNNDFKIANCSSLVSFSVALLNSSKNSRNSVEPGFPLNGVSLIAGYLMLDFLLSVDVFSLVCSSYLCFRVTLY